MVIIRFQEGGGIKLRAVRSDSIGCCSSWSVIFNLLDFFQLPCSLIGLFPWAKFCSRVLNYCAYPLLILISYFSASVNALLLVPKIILRGRKDSRTDARTATCNI